MLTFARPSDDNVIPRFTGSAKSIPWNLVQRSHQKRSGCSRLHAARRSLFSPMMIPSRTQARRSPSSQSDRKFEHPFPQFTPTTILGGWKVRLNVLGWRDIIWTITRGAGINLHPAGTDINPLGICRIGYDNHPYREGSSCSQDSCRHDSLQKMRQDPSTSLVSKY
jgi:hypothetical protein